MAERMYAHGDRDRLREEHGVEWYNRLTTSADWEAVMSRFPDQVRYYAANLAAHNWDVTLIGDRLLISSAWSGGDWYATDGSSSPMTEEELDRFYPQMNEQPEGWTWNEWHNRTTTQSGVRRSKQLVLA